MAYGSDRGRNSGGGNRRGGSRGRSKSNWERLAVAFSPKNKERYISVTISEETEEGYQNMTIAEWEKEDNSSPIASLSFSPFFAELFIKAVEDALEEADITDFAEDDPNYEKKGRGKSKSKSRSGGSRSRRDDDDDD